ncbi:MAG TPA: hypothetical protein VN860_05850 [Candidatus Acidoferrales bacterium]|nr:hypothetical protein [Candidatus Acidoferrales bacterium]
MTVLRAFVLTFISMAIVAELAFADSQSIPAGWFMAGSAPQLYTAGVDPNTNHDKAKSAYLASTQAEGTQFGTLMQMFSAQDYLGKRVSLSAYIKSAEVARRAALWMRVDGQGAKRLSFDNMADRPILGTTDWKEYTIVLDVPPESRDIALGVLLSGQGKVWVSGISLKSVSQMQPKTGVEYILPTQPQNLNFTHLGQK